MKKYFLYIITTIFVFTTVFTSCEKDEEIPTYTVRFDSKGGTPTPQEQTVKEGGKVTKPSDPTRDNYSFTGWVTADNETAALWSFETGTVTGNITLFAQWAINTYTVTFDSDGGSAVAAQNVTHGNTASKPTDPTRYGYEFDGWFNGDTEWNFANAITAPITLKAKWTALYTVTFDSDGGSAVSAQTIRNGATATKPIDPTKEFKPSSGLYLGVVNIDVLNCTFIEWRKEGENTAYDFNIPVTAPITLKAFWSTPSFSQTPITSVLPNDIAASFTYVNANSYSGEEYTLLIGAPNIQTGAQTLNAANAKLTIMGTEAEKTITSISTSSYGRLFSIDGNNATSLTLGQNITLKSGGGSGLITELIIIQRGSLTMLNGSKITEDSPGGTTVNSSGAVLVEGLNSIFKMDGGEITGIRISSVSPKGTVHVKDGGSFEMNGGSIISNASVTSGMDDLYISHNGTFRLSGNAKIGALMLNANSATERSSINIAGNYSGTVTRLHLRGQTTTSNNVSIWWTNAPVIVNATVNVINMFNNGLGSFYYGTSGTYAIDGIGATHVLNASGVLVLKEN